MSSITSYVNEMQVERRVGMRPRYVAPLLAANISLDAWRKSSQFSTLTHAHAALVATEVLSVRFAALKEWARAKLNPWPAASHCCLCCPCPVPNQR